MTPTISVTQLSRRYRGLTTFVIAQMLVALAVVAVVTLTPTGPRSGTSSPMCTRPH